MKFQMKRLTRTPELLGYQELAFKRLGVHYSLEELRRSRVWVLVASGGSIHGAFQGKGLWLDPEVQDTLVRGKFWALMALETMVGWASGPRPEVATDLS